MSVPGVGDKNERAQALLLAHMSRLDPGTPTAFERLELALGADLARKLVYALRKRSAA